ncbi:hypothetical protein [Piscibacillus halophilus]|uniref:YolD-like protein n=1 Tax=Piscibacillus halophilus TaxID=571933 RepID=A0A1H9CNT1_9BACI|nr:hypothetical protein [Piscibacillus halophilus]SEQ02875.1 hypothetical protein SAMN05216362_105123 [Piscibacillus halophilus]
MDLNERVEHQSLPVSFKELNEESKHTIFDSLIGKRIAITSMKNHQPVIIEGVLENKGLYLGEVAYDLRVNNDLRPIKVNMLYDIHEITILDDMVH